MSLDLSRVPVYLVEPSAAQARAITALLTKQGVRPVTHFEGAAARLARAPADPPGLVVSALYLPDMDGTQLVHALRAQQGSDDTPVILISSETDASALDPIRQSGICAILPKPFTPVQLEAALRAALDYADDTAPLDLHRYAVADVRVLLVDDSGSARRFTRRMLENLGLATFTEAENGRIASNQLADTTFDLVVTDYNMPECDGRELAVFIRQQSWQQDLPVLMITSESNPDRIAAIHAAGVSAVLGKPLDPDDLRTTLQRLLDA